MFTFPNSGTIMNTSRDLLRLWSSVNQESLRWTSRQSKGLKFYQEKFTSPGLLNEYLREHGRQGEITCTRDDKHHQVYHVTLNNLAKKNALSGKMMVDLRRVARELTEHKKTRLAVVRGAEGTFCSGGDIEFVKAIANEEGAYVMSTVMGETLSTIANSSFVSLAVLEGFTLGGGTEIASACDLRIVHKNAKVGFVQGRMGVSPGWGGGRFIVQALGRSRAIEYLATGAVLGAEELVKIGYASAVFDEEAEVAAFIEKMNNSIGLAALHGAKEVVHGHADSSNGNATEKKVFMQLWGGHEHLTALANLKKHK